MSIEAMNWALQQDAGSSSAKLVLLVLANRANADGICWPGFGGIASQAELSRRAVINNIARLENEGLIEVLHREKNKSNVYRLALPGSERNALVQELHSAADALGSARDALAVVNEVHPGSAPGAPEPSITQIQPKGTGGDEVESEAEDDGPPDDLNLEAWQRYEQHRRDNRWKKLTDKGAKAAQLELARYPPDVQMEAVARSERHGWMGIFPEKVVADAAHQQDDRFAATRDRLAKRAGRMPGGERLD